MTDPSGRLELPRGPRSGDAFVVDVVDMDARKGRGLAYLEADIGPQKEPRTYSVLVRKGVPGDRVKIGVEAYKKSRMEARIDEFVEPSPMRVEPRCQHYGRREIPGKGCGGCTLQALDYRHQLIVKEKMVKGLMQRAGIDPGLVHPTLGMASPWYYRNKVELSFGDDHERQFALGFHPTGYKHDVLALKECHLMSEFVSAFVPAVQQWCAEQGLEKYHHRSNTGWLRTLTIREGKRTGDRMVELTTTPDPNSIGTAQAFADFALGFANKQNDQITNIIWTQHHAQRGSKTWFEHQTLHGSDTLREELHLGRELSFEIHPRAFFQPNTLGAEMLYTKIIERAELNGATLLDLYCGTGTIGIALAGSAKNVVGVDIVQGAIDNAHRNAAQNGVENAEFICGDVGAILDADQLKGDIAVLDPPRAGLLPNAHEHLDASGVERLVYVSCNPRSLARDLVNLHERGWKTHSIEPVDMFPQTHHIENVALLTR